MVESNSETNSDLQYLVAELQQMVKDDEYIAKCSELVKKRFDLKDWGAPELRKTEVMLDGSIKDEAIKERVSELFGHFEDNPPSDRIKKACAENLHRAGGKLLDRSKYSPNPPLTEKMKEMARNFANSCTDKAWEAELYPFGEL